MSKVFISYSWTSEAHKKKISAWAEQLQQQGIEIILDTNDLKTGQDKYVFMERIVNDPTISKVLLMCDEQYAEKGNNRKGGVGAEAQIMADAIYKDVNQTKFLPVILETRNGEPCCPTFVKSRKYLDFSTPKNVELHFSDLLAEIRDIPNTSAEFNSPPTPGLSKLTIELDWAATPCVSDATVDSIAEDLIYAAKKGIVPPAGISMKGLAERQAELECLEKSETLTSQDKRHRLLLFDDVENIKERLRHVDTALTIAFMDYSLKMLFAYDGYGGVAAFLKGYFRTCNDNKVRFWRSGEERPTKVELWRDDYPKLGFSFDLTPDEVKVVEKALGFSIDALGCSGFWMVDLTPPIVIQKALPHLIWKLSMEDEPFTDEQLEKLVNPMAWRLGLA